MPIARWSAHGVIHEGLRGTASANQPAGARLSGAADQAAALQFIDPMLRRRLSSLAKSCLAAAQACAGDVPAVRVVYTSAHGDLRRTHSLLEDLARDEPLSPAAFGLSVLNATAGIFSIARGDISASTALTAGAESFGLGLLEAYGQWMSDPSSPVLLIHADDPLPEPYASQQNTSADAPAQSLAVLLGGGTDTVSVSCEVQPDDPVAGVSEDSAGSEPQCAAFMRAMEQGSAQWRSGGRRWTWRCT